MYFGNVFVYYFNDRKYGLITIGKGGSNLKILVAGGAGFIGAHTCVTLLEAGHKVIIADNLCNSSMKALSGIEQISGEKFDFYQIDVTDKSAVEALFAEEDVEGVIHFAGHKAVGESVQEPLKYYHNNVLSTIVLAEACVKHGVKSFVFSSSATVYGANRSPMTEEMTLMPAENPYGETKVISEKILTDVAKACPGLSVSLLRYFNPVGAHESALIGEASKEPFRPISCPESYWRRMAGSIRSGFSGEIIRRLTVPPYAIISM